LAQEADLVAIAAEQLVRQLEHRVQQIHLLDLQLLQLSLQNNKQR
jgi:hypothetical protein